MQVTRVDSSVTGRTGLIPTAILALLASATLAHASLLGLGNTEPGAGAPSGFIIAYLPWLEPAISYINARQQEFYRALTGSLKAMRTDVWQIWWLVGVSFLYGVFHAAGPGHGKAVISSYMIANETELKRGVLISFMSAFVQGAVAILVTLAGFLILRGTTITMTDAAKWLEVLSFAAIMAFGFYLLYRKTRGMFGSFAGLAAPQMAIAGVPMGHDHDHRYDHSHDHAHHFHGHDHGHSHGVGQVCEVCGHSHAPTPDLVAGEKFSLADAWSAIVTVGLRPCSGALFVLTFSFLNGLYLAGVLSVLAMSIGTAITVSILATIAVTAKDLAVRYAGSGAAAGRVASTIEILGAVGVILFGFMFLMASLQG